VLATKITVGIPTFNGSQYISEAIQSVLSNITEELRGRVQVLVSDNCSSDATPAIVASLVSLHPGIVSYRRNEKNIGFDGNVQSVFEAATGDYVHILGDDDVLAPGSLRRLVRVLDGDGSLSVILGRVDFLDIVGGNTSMGPSTLRTGDSRVATTSSK
jgi:glycosyltransferase involved in cell wall biosynthesis